MKIQHHWYLKRERRFVWEVSMSSPLCLSLFWAAHGWLQYSAFFCSDWNFTAKVLHWHWRNSRHALIISPLLFLMWGRACQDLPDRQRHLWSHSHVIAGIFSFFVNRNVGYVTVFMFSRPVACGMWPTASALFLVPWMFPIWLRMLIKWHAQLNVVAET